MNINAHVCGIKEGGMDVFYVYLVSAENQSILAELKCGSKKHANTIARYLRDCENVSYNEPKEYWGRYRFE